MMAWTRVVAVGVVRIGPFLDILKVKPNEFPNGYASKSGLKNESRFLASETGRIKLQLSKKEKAASRTGFSGKTGVGV